MRVWHPVQVSDDAGDPASMFVDVSGGGRARFEVILRDVAVWRLVVARVASWLLCACCRDWPYRIGWGRRDEVGIRVHTLGGWWFRVYGRLTGLDLPPEMVRLAVAETDLVRVATRFVVRARVEHWQELMDDAAADAESAAGGMDGAEGTG